MYSQINRNSSPGNDGITTEHLVFANCDPLYFALANVYSLILSYHIVPKLFQMSVIVPVLKKPTLNPNECSSFRPITISSTLTKLAELFLLPSQELIAPNQYGFRRGRDTLAACSFINDIQCYFKDQQSPVFICSLDAEKCFDRIWHAGLLYKVRNIFPVSHWLFLYQLYSHSFVSVKWFGEFSNAFQVTRGTKQGSVLSPVLFNLFVNDLLLEINESRDGVCIGDNYYGGIAYADDVTLISASAPGLQRLIDTCYSYANKWRFNYGIQKSKCMISGKLFSSSKPEWHLGGQPISIVDSVDILGVNYSRDAQFHNHVTQRTSACRRCMFSLQDVGMCYPGLSTEVKTHLWKSMGLPTLLYGAEAVDLKSSDINSLKTTQGSHIKRCLGLSKRSHTSQLQEAAEVDDISSLLAHRIPGLFHRLCRYDSPSRSLNISFLSHFISSGKVVQGTLFSRLVSLGLSPAKCMFTKPLKARNVNDVQDGIVESLRFLIHSEHFVKPWMSDHVLVQLLTSSF